ncbi:hypothetical protein FM042_06030 [Aliidiomarina halalkaliphila]|uniref:SCP domain-containing protein n=1 Tax=Aliidiomarina halalkaliphila TaxID=2593535 RepID=A0A552X5T5_9GAMM|nr:hypothetical protein [Aliidiomarina halalkaliphila]TRW50387.1 hypothetical protein FM042_06030 [Aliidiomarina halalkaliphila]
MRYLRFLSTVACIIGACLASPVLLANTNECSNFQNQALSQCAHYQYNVFNLHFRDSANIEHDVSVYRVKDSQGNVVSADVDFKIRCGDACLSNPEGAIEDILWAFRASYLADSFYYYRDCDSTLEVCCDDDSCFEIHGGDNSPAVQDDSLEDSSTSSDVSPAALSRGKKILDLLPIVDSGLNIYDRLMNDSKNEKELREALANAQETSSKFVLINTSGGGNQVCVDDGQVCTVLDGHVSISSSFANADLSHSNGFKFNQALADWLNEWFEGQNGLVCSQRMSCDHANNCTVTLSCR